MKQPKPTLASLARELERLHERYGTLSERHGTFVEDLASALGCQCTPNAILSVVGEYVAALKDKKRRERIEDQERAARLGKDNAVTYPLTGKIYGKGCLEAAYEAARTCTTCSEARHATDLNR